MIIKVTQEHIRCGIKGKALCCPVALAIQQTIGVRFVVVSCSGFSINGNYHSFNNDQVSDFIDNFDRGEKVCPMEFEIDY